MGMSVCVYSISNSIFNKEAQNNRRDVILTFHILHTSLQCVARKTEREILKILKHITNRVVHVVHDHINNLNHPA